MRGVSVSRLEFRGAELPVQGSFDSMPREDRAELISEMQARDAPMHPKRFAETLEAKIFTNGSDKDVVLETYKQTFDIIKRVRQQVRLLTRWTLGMTQQYCEVLSEFEDLEVP